MHQRGRGSRRDHHLLRYVWRMSQSITSPASRSCSSEEFCCSQAPSLQQMIMCCRKWHYRKVLCKLAEILAVQSMDLQSSNFPVANPVHRSGGTMVEQQLGASCNMVTDLEQQLNSCSCNLLKLWSDVLWSSFATVIKTTVMRRSRTGGHLTQQWSAVEDTLERLSSTS